jgi:hypothetical protein
MINDNYLLSRFSHVLLLETMLRRSSTTGLSAYG